MSPFNIIPSSFFNKPWHRFVNGAEEEIPAYACMRILGATELDNDIVFQVAKPNDEEQPFYLVNGPLAVANDPVAEGRCTTSMQAAYVLVGGGPVFGDRWGPTDGSWQVSEEGTGFLMLGPAQSDPTRAPAVQSVSSPVAIATAWLAEKMCGLVPSEAVQIDHFKLQAGTMPGTEPNQALNHLLRQGPVGQIVVLNYFLFDPFSLTPLPHWAIVAVMARPTEILVKFEGDGPLRIDEDGEWIEGYMTMSAQEFCNAPDWQKLIPISECVTA